jgi:hypothetical protein
MRSNLQGFSRPSETRPRGFFSAPEYQNGCCGVSGRCGLSKKNLLCRKESGTSTAMSPVFSAHRTFANRWGTRAQNPTLSQHCGTSHGRRRDLFKVFVTRSYARVAKNDSFVVRCVTTEISKIWFPSLAS